jgi:hypothetical protein
MIEPEHRNEIILDDNYDNYVIHADHEVEKECNTNPETMYNHFNKDYKYTDIQEILNLENHSDDGKLYTKVKWNNQQDTLIPAELIHSDDPLRLAKHIRDNPVE